MNTLRIMIKDIRSTAPITAALLLLYGILALFAHTIPTSATFACALALYGVYIISAILATERYEEKNNGYLNLLRMPVLPVELAVGKLLLMYLLNALGCGLAVIFVRAFGTGERMVHIFQSIALMEGCVWLVLLPVIYSGICIWGFTKFIIAFRIGILALLVAVQALGVIVFRVGKDLPPLLDRIGDGIAGAPWLPVCVLVTAGYFAYAGSAGGLVRLHGTR